MEYNLFMEPGFNAILLLLNDDSFCWINLYGSICGGYSIQSIGMILKIDISWKENSV